LFVHLPSLFKFTFIFFGTDTPSPSHLLPTSEILRPSAGFRLFGMTPPLQSSLVYVRRPFPHLFGAQKEENPSPPPALRRKFNSQFLPLTQVFPQPFHSGDGCHLTVVRPTRSPIRPMSFPPLSNSPSSHVVFVDIISPRLVQEFI